MLLPNYRVPMDRPLGPLVAWLALAGLAVYSMVIIGGITRLTGSGLSMVDWRPLLGAIPPLSPEHWQQTFDAYRQYPEYRQINPGMTLAEFKFIFFWEYIHRLMGRVIALVYALPLIWFWVRGYLTGSLKLMLSLIFLLGALQGLLGWYMVQSGLIDTPEVSHYRLAAHLGLALLVLACIVWLLLGVLDARNRLTIGSWRPGRFVSLALLVLLAVQLLFGAFTAGLNAGLGYNTFPRMNDRWVAEAVFGMKPWWINLLDSRATIQFVHRCLGVLLLLAVIVWWLAEMKRQGFRGLMLLHSLLTVTFLQVLLGIFALLFLVPVTLASIHQAVACLLLINLLLINYLAFRQTGRANPT